MYFFIDTKDQTIKAFYKMGDAARFALDKIGHPLPVNSAPVKVFHDQYKDSAAILNLSAAFESISESEEPAATELAEQFKRAVDDYYQNKAQ